MFICNVILNLLLLSGTLGINHMGMKKGFAEKNKWWITVNPELCAKKRPWKITKHYIFNPLNHYWISNIEILQSSLGKTMVSVKKYLVPKIYLITQKKHNFWMNWPNLIFFLPDFFTFEIMKGQFYSILL